MNPFKSDKLIHLGVVKGGKTIKPIYGDGIRHLTQINNMYAINYFYWSLLRLLRLCSER